MCQDHATQQVAENRALEHLVVLATNNIGWQRLLEITADSNLPEHFYHKPRLNLYQIAEYLDGNLIGFSGHLGSTVANKLFSNGKPHSDWKQRGERTIKFMKEIFGPDNFYLETQLMMAHWSKRQVILTNMVRELGQLTKTPVIATPDSHYATQEDSELQRILLCNATHQSIYELRKKDSFSAFFNCNNFHLPSTEEMLEYGHTEEELNNTVEIENRIEHYTNILQPPSLPSFSCPNNLSPQQYLRELCIKGWKSKIEGRVDDSLLQEYGARVKRELGVFEEANLSGYFLICSDIINYIHSNGWLPGPARGSVGGSLVSYLVGITELDPIPYNLLFERFYNKARAKGSLPDIDLDIPSVNRSATIDYIKNKYGQNNVAGIITFHSLGGRESIKAVCRAFKSIAFEEMNRITKNIKEGQKISGELQQMETELGYQSEIRWTLENEGNKLEPWCKLNKDGSLSGPLAKEFEYAMKLENTLNGQSKHAAGIVISDSPLKGRCPLVLDTKEKQLITGWEMEDVESGGLLKLDILGLSLLSKLMSINTILEYGKI